MANPTFGEKKANTDYVSRYGVYAVIPDAEQKQIVLVQAPNGAWFLPCLLYTSPSPRDS